MEKPFANEVQINPYVYCLEKETLDLCFEYNIQLIAYSPLRFNAATIVLQDTGMHTIAEDIYRYYYSAIIACMVTFKENLRHSQKQHHTTTERKFGFRGCYLYSVLHFSDDVDKISEGKDPTAFLLYNAEKSQEDANRLRLLIWNDDV